MAVCTPHVALAAAEAAFDSQPRGSGKPPNAKQPRNFGRNVALYPICRSHDFFGRNFVDEPNIGIARGQAARFVSLRI